MTEATLVKPLVVQAEWTGTPYTLPAGEVVQYELVHTDVYHLTTRSARTGQALDAGSVKALALTKAVADPTPITVQCGTCAGSGVRGRSGGPCRKCSGQGGWPGTTPVSKRR